MNGEAILPCVFRHLFCQPNVWQLTRESRKHLTREIPLHLETQIGFRGRAWRCRICHEFAAIESSGHRHPGVVVNGLTLESVRKLHSDLELVCERMGSRNLGGWLLAPDNPKRRHARHEANAAKSFLDASQCC